MSDTIPAGTREIEIVVPGPYNDATDRVQALGTGARLVTRVWYAENLVQSGFARWPEAVATATVAELPVLEVDMQALEEAERAIQKAVQEEATAWKGKKRATGDGAAVGKPRRARKKATAT